jgi:uncharacterized CHY-type Zn-finger protein
MSEIDFSYQWFDDGFLGGFTMTCPHCNHKRKKDTVEVYEEKIICPNCLSSFRVRCKVWIEDLSVCKENTNGVKANE